jgi:DNA-binding response OmpR family regulator
MLAAWLDYCLGNLAKREPLSGNTNHPSHGGRILVAEDSYLLAEVIADYLRDLGMEPVGPVGHLQEACYLARERALDGAVLDIKLRDALCFPAASILLARGIPFVFISGYSDTGLIPLECRGAPLVYKPFEADELKEAISALLAVRRLGAAALSQAPSEPRPVTDGLRVNPLLGEPPKYR